MATKSDYVLPQFIDKNKKVKDNRYNDVSFNCAPFCSISAEVDHGSSTTSSRFVCRFEELCHGYSSKSSRGGSSFLTPFRKSFLSGVSDVFDETEKVEVAESSVLKRSLSTLSLHIAAYENSRLLETESDWVGKTNKRLPNRITSLILQDPFEFPRQQQEGSNTEPAVCQFRASQKLLVPDQTSQCSRGKPVSSLEKSNDETFIERCGAKLSSEKLSALLELYRSYLDNDTLQTFKDNNIPEVGAFVNGFKVIAYIGAGGFGSVVLAQRDNMFFAMKFFPYAKRGYKTKEFNALHKNLISDDYPNLFTAFKFGIYESAITDDAINGESENSEVIWRKLKQCYMVTQLTGINLNSLEKQQRQDGTPMPQQLERLKGALKALEAVHKQNWVHHDVKPENFCVDINDEKHVFLIDYGMITASPETKGEARFQGTYIYASRNALKNQKQNFRDDSESWVNMLLELVLGELPWINFLEEESLEKQKEFWKNPDVNIHVLRIMKHVDYLAFREKMNFRFVEECLQDYIDELSGKEYASFKYGSTTRHGKCIIKGSDVFGQNHCGSTKTTFKCKKCAFKVYVETSHLKQAKPGDVAIVVDVHGQHNCK